MLYEKNKFNLRTLNLKTHFKEHIMFASWGWPLYSYLQHNTFIHSNGKNLEGRKRHGRITLTHIFGRYVVGSDMDEIDSRSCLRAHTSVVGI
jgi:hypothetical protein